MPQRKAKRAKRKRTGYLIQSWVTTEIGDRVKRAAKREEISAAAVVRRLINERFGDEKPENMKGLGEVASAG